MEGTDLLVEPLGDSDSIADKIGELIREAQSTSDIKQKLVFLNKVGFAFDMLGCFFLEN